ncbi:C40 family peptidase [Alicyclobacillus acidiphilus]|uniref:C40 family peptidase n=1 Tax=Alicyclobacillus acidiphilus TaxID=182455 RepID=UPI00083304B1|nr:C40 family peptidase [Alicyclobacillus acidiphilus]
MRIHIKPALAALVMSSLLLIPSAQATTVPSSQGSLTHQETDVSSLQLSEQQQILVKMAETQLNVPYVWGKQEPFVGFDCSNFVAWVYRAALGIDFSGSSVWQRNNAGTPVSTSDLQVGDLLFFKTANEPNGSGHVGIYIGNGDVIQEGGGWKKVTIEPLKGTWLGKNLVFARRILK